MPPAVGRGAVTRACLRSHFRVWEGVEMVLSIEVDRDFPVVRVAGELDHATVPAVAAPLQEQIENGCSVLVLDLEGVTFMDSSALGLFVSHHKTLQRRHGALRIANAPSRVLAVLTMTGLDRFLAVYPSVEGALAVVG